jgi:branched-chain amino acid transport system substrate-binding protein
LENIISNSQSTMWLYFGGEVDLLNSEALTRIQSLILIAVIVVAAVGGAIAYFLLSGEQQSSETIKIGVCADLDGFVGKSILQGAKMAAEEVNAEGGVLGMNLEIVAQDDDSETSIDPIAASKAFTKLISVDNADFTISYVYGLTYREIAFEYEKILFTVGESTEELTLGVLDNYERYKYYFRAGSVNETAGIEGLTMGLDTCRNHTGFNKIAFLYHQVGVESLIQSVTEDLENHGFHVVLSESVAFDAIDYSSYFAKAEAAGAEILYPIILGTGGIQFVKEYYDRQSPMVMWGLISQGSRTDFSEVTGGKCEDVAIVGYPIVAGYPLTSKTVPTRDAYIERWGEAISPQAASAYDTVRFILPNAIERVGTIETEAVIKALEETDIETSVTRRFVFTSSHDVMFGTINSTRSLDYSFNCLFQWQEGEQVPVFPVEIMEEAGATFTFPDWSGPWDNIS